MVDKERIANAVREILIGIGEDPDREGLLETPLRVANMYAEVFSGLHEDPMQHIKVFTEDHDEMIVVKDIPFYSMCEHHLVPFFGLANVAYIPRNGKILGLSKLARIVGAFARRPQLQERLTSQIADFIMEAINPQSVMVFIDAEHMCMTMRGVKASGAKTRTSAVRGLARTDIKTRSEVLTLMGVDHR